MAPSTWIQGLCVTRQRGMPKRVSRRRRTRLQIEELESRCTPSLTDLVSFPAGASANASGPIRDSRGDLFGTTQTGGSNGNGSIFEVVAGNSTITTLASFTGPNGADPVGGVIEDSSGDLFGTTLYGGAAGAGTIFELLKGNSTVTTLASFTGANGAYPLAGVVEDANGNLFGTTESGGANNAGTVYELGKGNPSITTLASFTFANGGILNEGNFFVPGHLVRTPSVVPDNPGDHSGVILDSSGDLLGTTFSGGASGDGTVFEVMAGSGAITTLATFTGTGAIGANPVGGVIQDASGNLFGATATGGTGTFGTLFELTKGSSTITTLYSFPGFPGSLADGATPLSGVVEDAGGDLFGTTSSGGANEDGTVFVLRSGQTTVTSIVSFTTADTQVNGNLVIDSNDDLFGSTDQGTADQGTVFEVPGNTTTLNTVATFAGLNTVPNGTLSNVILDGNGNLFGTTAAGGTTNQGTLFEVAKGSGAITNLASVNGGTPSGLVEAAGPTFFGTTQTGGTNGAGSVFNLPTGTVTTQTSASFNTNTNGQPPDPISVIEDGSGNLFGITAFGGASGDGTVFEVVKNSGSVTTLASFNGGNGLEPLGGLVEDSSGNLFGVTAFGGASSAGVVFEVAKGTNAITDLATFTGSGASGSFPTGVTVDGSGNLFGTTQNGGSTGAGTVFEVVKNSGTITTLASFTVTNGSQPVGGVFEDSSGNLFGVTAFGGANAFSGGDAVYNSLGSMYEVPKGTGKIFSLATFNFANGAWPGTALSGDGSGDLFGTTRFGGPNGGGAVFELSIPPVVTSVSPQSGPNGTTMTIHGTYLNGATAVDFGATPATTFTVDSPTQITATVPGGSGTVDITVTTPNGGSSTSSADQFTYGNQNATTTTVTASANPSVFGQSVTFTASVTTNAPGAGTPTGTVQFQVDGVNFGNPVSLSSGSATLQAAALSVATHTITAIYSGDGNDNASSGDAAPQVVNKDTPTMAITASANPAASGQSVTFTATVTASAPGAGTPTGTVQFQIDGSAVGTSSLNSSGQATFTVSNLTAGAHQVSASYGGDANFGTATTASPLVETVSGGSHNQISTALPLGPVTTAPVVTTGAIVQPTDVDMFQFTATAGETIGFNVSASPGSPLDCLVRLFDANGNQLAITSPLTLVSGIASFNFPFAVSGTYYLAVSGYPNMNYDPVTGAGVTSGSTGAYNITLTPNPPENDPNDRISAATSLGNAGRVHQVSNYFIGAPTDVDMFRFSAARGQQVTIRIGRPAGSSLASLLRLFDAHGRQLAVSHGGQDAVLTFKFKAGGTYYVGVSGRGNAAYDPITGLGDQPGSIGGYTIALVPGVPHAIRNGELDTALAIGAIAGTRHIAGSLDAPAESIFSFTVATGQRVAFSASGSARPYVRLFDGNGVELANSGGGTFTFTFLLGGTYYLGISARGARTYDAVTGTSTGSASGHGSFDITAVTQGMEPSPFAAGPGAAPALLSYSAPTSGGAGGAYFDQSGLGQIPASAAGEGEHMVFLDRNHNGIRDDGEPATFTNAQGQFLLDGLVGSAPLAVAPLTQFGIPIEKVTAPALGYYVVHAGSRQAEVHLSFGLSRYEG